MATRIKCPGCGKEAVTKAIYTYQCKNCKKTISVIHHTIEENVEIYKYKDILYSWEKE